MIGTMRIPIIAGVVVLLFGATTVSRLARSSGKARAGSEKGIKEGRNIGPEGPDGGREEGSRK